MNKRTKWLMVALAMIGVAGAVMGQTSGSSSSGGAVAGHWHHHGHGMMVGGGLLRAVHQLNLTPAQQ
jgi:hypothetical protein